MMLFYSSGSPFVRKVMACAMACGLESRIEKVTSSPWDTPPDLISRNPLSKVPCLVTDDGLALFDSPVICEYLNEIGEGDLLPKAGAPRWRALKLQALADGIMDASVLRRREQTRADDEGRAASMARQEAVVARGLDMLDGEPPPEHLDLGSISVACALGYLDFRFAEEPWRPTRPRLAQWFNAMQSRPELAATAPT